MEQMRVKSHLVNNSVSMYLIGQANPELFKVSCVSIAILVSMAYNVLDLTMYFPLYLLFIFPFLFQFRNH